MGLPHVRRDIVLHLPLLILLAILIAPTLGSLVMSLTQARAGVVGFGGFTNYARISGDRDFVSALKNTLAFALLTVPLQLGLGWSVAYLLRTPFRGRSFVRVVLLLPWLISSIANGVMWRYLLNEQIGIVNTVAHWLGLAAPPSLLGSRALAFWVVSIVEVWRTFPFAATLLLPGFESVPTDLWDQLRLDGAGFIRRLLIVSVPQRPLIVTLGVLLACDALGQFDTVWLLTGGGPGTATTVLAMYAYQHAFQTNAYALGAAAAWIVGLLCLGVGLFALRWSHDSAGEETTTQTVPDVAQTLTWAQSLSVAHSVLIMLVVLMCSVPLLWTLAASVGITPALQHLTLDHYAEIATDAFGIMRALVTSMVIAILATTLATVAALPAAHRIARSHVRAKTLALTGLLLLATLPVLSFAIPMREIMRGLGLLDTFLGVTLAQAALATPLCVYFLYGYMAQIHPDIEDAAKLDGADAFQALTHLLLPMIRLGITATAIIVMALNWNAFIIPLVLSGVSIKTVTVTMSDFFLFERELEWPTAAAALIASLLPLALLVTVARRGLDQLRLTSLVR